MLAGVRPEELAEWAGGPVAPVGAVSFAAPADAQGQAIEHAIEQGRRVAARGGDAVVSSTRWATSSRTPRGARWRRPATSRTAAR